MLPTYNWQPYFISYFIIYLLMQLVIFVPIPVAVVFEAFRNHRSKLVLSDRFK